MRVSAAAYPPEPEKLGELYELGYRDALAWLLKNGKVRAQDLPLSGRPGICIFWPFPGCCLGVLLAVVPTLIPAL